MRILITGSLVFLLWAFVASWFYVSKIKPSYETPAETAIVADTAAIEPSPPVVVEIPKPETLVLYFAYDRADVNVSPETEHQSQLINEWIGKHPDATLSIIGHTDNKGPNSYNQSLGIKRAENTKQYFTGKGILSEKIKTESKGESVPIADNKSEENRAKNRRAEITIK